MSNIVATIIELQLNAIPLNVHNYMLLLHWMSQRHIVSHYWSLGGER